MHILSASGLAKHYGERTLFSDVQFDVQEKDRIGLVGANGTGKTTLFRMITGEETPDEGGFAKASGLQIGYMRQHVLTGAGHTALELVQSVFAGLIQLEQQLEELEGRLDTADAGTIARHHTILETFQREGGLTYKARSQSALLGLGFTQEETTLPVSSLSGGQRSKISLARLLVSSPDLLLLDEPTNHLDTQAVEWLEDYLRSYPKAAVIISHDRYFLDRVTTRTFEIASGKLTAYNGGYTVSMEQRELQRDILIKQYKDQTKEIRRIEGIIEQQRRWNRERNIRMAESKQKQLDKLVSSLVQPDSEEKAIRFAFAPKRPSGQDVLSVKNLHMEYDKKRLYCNANLQIYKGERVFLLGRNGCGKTTLLRQIVQNIPGVQYGMNVQVGYYDQTQELLSDHHTVFDEVSDAYPALSGTEIRNALAAFLFRGEDVFKRIADLSGGEKARVSLLNLMLSGSNLLILDEPTNHLDIGSREALEKALLGYAGSMLIVSHDRYFINKCAHRLYELTEQGTTAFAGNYDYYLEHRRTDIEQNTKKKDERPANDYQLRKDRASQLRRLATQIKRCEDRVERLAHKTAYLEQAISLPETAADYTKLMELTGQLEELRAEEEKVITEWERAAGEQEQLLAENP